MLLKYITSRAMCLNSSLVWPVLSLKRTGFNVLETASNSQGGSLVNDFLFYALTIRINFSKDYCINEAVFSGLPI